MTYNPDIHHRRSIRLRNYDYSQGGAYFITLCAFQRECLFGEIVEGEMLLNEMGRIVLHEWERIEKIRNNVMLDEFIIMPNHFHGILFLSNDVGAMPTVRPPFDDTDKPGRRENQGDPLGTPLHGFVSTFGRPVGIDKSGRPVGIAPTGPVAGSIGAIMAQFKSRVTKSICGYSNNPGCSVWQRNYYERVIRNDDELNCARDYIVNNPLKWELDKENPKNCP